MCRCSGLLIDYYLVIYMHKIKITMTDRLALYGMMYVHVWLTT